MRYRTDVIYDHGPRQNESRADLAEWMLAVGSDRGGEQHPSDVENDVSDALAHFVHFCARAGLDFDAVCDHAVAAFEGDLQDGPRPARDADRFSN